MEEIVILNSNDLHSHFENWPKIRRYFNKEKKQLEAEGATCLTLELGDFSDRVHPYTEATDGLFNTKLMNEVAFDAATIGNNEGIGNSFHQLNQLYDEAEFDVLVANLFEKETGERPVWAKPYKIIETAYGTKVALIGLTAVYPLTYEPNGWTICSATEVLSSVLTELDSKADVIILMSHLGIKEDKKLAQLFPNITLILGAHTHHLLEQGLLVNQVLLTGAGKFGQYIGVTRLTLENKQVQVKKTKAIKVSELRGKVADSEEISGYLKAGQALLKAQPVAYLPKSLGRSDDFYQGLAEEALAALKEYARAEGAIINSGLFLTSLKAGLVTKKELHDCLPHPMRIIKVTLLGQDLTELLRTMSAQQKELLAYPIQGMGFRGKVFGKIMYAGISCDEKGNSYWQGEPIVATQKYSFATVDHLLFIPLFPLLSERAEVEFLFPEFLREVLGQYLSEHYPC